MKQRILSEYLNLEPASAIASKYGLKVDYAKDVLRDSLSRTDYLGIAHRISAKTVRRKLEDPEFRKSYSEKMKRSVKASLDLKMRSPEFNSRWKSKARKGSKLGNRRIRELLSDPSYSSNWASKCSLGGKLIRDRNKGIFDQSRARERAHWSLRGLQNTGRKRTGPLGERMYNRLEVQTARSILDAGLSYEYEKRFDAYNLNGFFSVDFMIREVQAIIEVTYWDDLIQKSAIILRKFLLLKKKYPAHSFVIVTKPSMCEHYKWLLPEYVTVLTANQLGPFLAGFRYSKRSGVTNSEK